MANLKNEDMKSTSETIDKKKKKSTSETKYRSTKGCMFSKILLATRRHIKHTFLIDKKHRLGIQLQTT